MRAIFGLAVIAVLMGLAGWLTFANAPDKASVNIETSEIRRDAKMVVESAEQLVNSQSETHRSDKPRD